MFKRLSAFFVAGALLGGSPLLAQQDALLEELYGSGVHQYFDGQYFEAHTALTAAIEQGSQDPRAYYFRAMTYLRLGRPDEAAADMQRGAELEASDVSGFYPVARSLERVQGEGRLMLERYRLQARAAQYARRQNQLRERYEALQRREAEVLRQQANIPFGSVDPAPADAAPAPAGESPAVAEPLPSPPVEDAPVEADDPFGAPAPAQPAAEPAMEAPAADDDPFGAAPAPAMEQPAAADDPFGAPAQPAGNDPFGAAPAPAQPAGNDPFGAAPADNAPGAAAPAAAAGNAGQGQPRSSVVGALGRALGRAVAGDDDAADAEAVQPAAPAGANEAMPFDDNDPFGLNQPAAPAAQPAAGAQPAAQPAAGNDPFGAAPAPAMGQPAAADDPFGAPAQPADNDPFGAAPAAGNDPFGAAPAMENEADDEAEEPAAADANPFADDPAPAGGNLFD